MNIIVEGIDRIGKDTLINGLISTLGNFTQLHYTKPIRSKHYINLAKSKNLSYENSELFLYQWDSFNDAISLLDICSIYNINLILNRSWIGEYVYAPIYRKYNADYVFELEKRAKINNLFSTFLIILTTSCFDFIENDGNNFDFAKIQEENERFKDAFKLTVIHKKIIIDVNDNGKFKSKEEILNEALRFVNHF